MNEDMLDGRPLAQDVRAFEMTKRGRVIARPLGGLSGDEFGLDVTADPTPEAQGVGGVNLFGDQSPSQISAGRSVITQAEHRPPSGHARIGDQSTVKEI